jgi:hypothetical protein
MTQCKSCSSGKKNHVIMHLAENGKWHASRQPFTYKEANTIVREARQKHPEAIFKILIGDSNQ